MVWAALTFITHLPTKPAGTPVVVRVLRVSGTIKKAEEEVIRRSQIIIKRAKAWEAGSSLAMPMPMMQSIEMAVDKAREGEVLAGFDEGSEDEMSE